MDPLKAEQYIAFIKEKDPEDFIRFLISRIDEIRIYALWAVKKELISAERFATICMIWSAAQDFGTKNWQILSCEQLNQFLLKHEFGLSIDKFSQFLSQTHDLCPFNEDFVILCPFPAKNEWPTLLQRFEEIGFDSFMPFLEKEIYYLPIPSFSLMKARIQTEHPKNGIHSLLVLKEATIHDLERDTLFLYACF